MKNDIFYKTQTEWIEVLQQYYPDTDLYKDKYNINSDLYKFIVAKASALEYFEKKWQDIYDNSFIQNANLQTIIKFENDLGLPDSIFNETNNLDLRRQQCLIKQWINQYGVSSPQDYYQLASYLGFNNILIEFSGKNYSGNYFDNKFDNYGFDDDSAEAFTWFVNLPTSLLIENQNSYFDNYFDNQVDNSTPLNKLFLLFSKISPCYVRIIYQYTL